MRILAVLVGVVVMLVAGWLVLGAVDDPRLSDEGLDEAAATTEDLVPGALGGQAPGAACATDAQVVDAAADLFAASEGRPPTSVRELVDAAFLTEPSAYHDLEVAPDGTVTVVALPGRGCD